MSKSKARQNVQKLQQNIEKGLQNILAVQGSPEASAAAFFLMGNALYQSGNFTYSEKYYQKAQDLYKQDGASAYVAEAKLIKLYASSGRTEQVREGIANLKSSYAQIDHKPAVAKEIKEALSYYGLQKFPIQLDKILENCLKHLENNPAQTQQSPVKIGDIVRLDGSITARLEEVLAVKPSELAKMLANNGGVASYLANMFSALDGKISKLENETGSKLAELQSSINKKPNQDDLKKLASKTKKQIKEVYKHDQEEVSKLKEILTKVEANSVSKTDIAYIGARLDAADAKTLEGAQQISALRGIVGNIENKAAELKLDISSLEKTVETKTKDLAETIKTATGDIYAILETKANQDDLEYVNSELEEITSGKYNDTQKIKMLEQLTVNLEQKVQMQELTISEFKAQVEREFRQQQDALLELSNSIKSIESTKDITEHEIAKLIANAKKHSKAIAELKNNVQNIGGIVDPRIKEFIENYQNQNPTLNNIIDITHECKALNSSISNEEIAKMLSEELDKVKSELGAEFQHINDALTRTEIYKRAELSKAVTSLSNEDAIYAKFFAVSLCNYIMVYTEAKQGLFEVTKHKLAPNWFSSGVKLVPVIGNALEVITQYVNEIYGTIDTLTKQLKIEKISEIRAQHFAINDLQLYAQEVALDMLQNPAVHLSLHPSNRNNSANAAGVIQKTQKAYKQFKEAIDTYTAFLKQKTLGIDTVDADVAKISSIALQHVCIFMEALCKLGKDTNGISILPREQQLQDFVNNSVLNVANNSPTVIASLQDTQATLNHNKETKQDNNDDENNGINNADLNQFLPSLMGSGAAQEHTADF